jgi:hypothetical protein
VLRFGRRSLFLAAFTILSACLFALAILYTVAPRTQSVGKGLVAIISIYFGVWNGMGGPTAFVTSGEIPSNRLRSVTLGFGRGIGLLLSWLVVFTAPYFINPTALNWGGKGIYFTPTIEKLYSQMFLVSGLDMGRLLLFHTRFYM